MAKGKAKEKDILKEAEELLEGKTSVSTSVGEKEETFDKFNLTEASKQLALGNKLYLITNTTEYPFRVNWHLNLIPADMLMEAKQYMLRRYSDLGLDRYVKSGDITIVALSIQGQTINLVWEFMTEQHAPALVNVREGPTTKLRSMFVILPGETVLVDQRQYESLLEWVAKKRVLTSKQHGVTMTSSNLGFLKAREAKNQSQLKKADRSVISKQDLFLATYLNEKAIEVARKIEEKKEQRVVIL